MNLHRPIYLAAIFMCAIAVIGLLRVYDTLPPQAIGVTIVVVTSSILCLYFYNATFRNRIDLIPNADLICWHAIRAPIGAAFLVMAQEQLLPTLFATRAGYGDIAVAFAGCGVVGLGTNGRKCVIADKRIHLLWNVFGLCDLLIAVGTGLYLGLSIPNSMDWIARLPLLMVPMFIVPLLLSTHVIMLIRLLTNAKPAEVPKKSEQKEATIHLC